MDLVNGATISVRYDDYTGKWESWVIAGNNSCSHVQAVTPEEAIGRAVMLQAKQTAAEIRESQVK